MLHDGAAEIQSKIRANLRLLEQKCRELGMADGSPVRASGPRSNPQGITDATWTVAIPIGDDTLSGDYLNEMRRWLDQRRYEPSRFVYHLAGRRPAICIEFKVAREAEEFALAFRGEIVPDQC